MSFPITPRITQPKVGNTVPKYRKSTGWVCQPRQPMHGHCASHGGAVWCTGVVCHTLPPCTSDSKTSYNTSQISSEIPWKRLLSFIANLSKCFFELYGIVMSPLEIKAMKIESQSNLLNFHVHDHDLSTHVAQHLFPCNIVYVNGYFILHINKERN